MLVKQAPDIRSSEITDRKLYLRRREFIQAAAATAAGTAAGLLTGPTPAEAAWPRVKIPNVQKGPFATTEKQTPYDDVTTYNNYYEFGTDKGDPAVNAHTLKIAPWKVKVDGLVNKPGDYNLEDLIKPQTLEERVYRMRCVEAWSMVIPWVGYPLAALLKRVEPTGQAKYVEFQTLVDPEQFPGQRKGFFGFTLDWPYTEGLRLDEAMHPLTLVTVGLYGQVLPNQNGAPIRLVVPWKYGFKSAKSLVRIRLTSEEPKTAWNKAAGNEYGFYSNVNPEVSHPRWSQATERRIGELRRRDTLMFNGYGDQVASLYAGMDLKRFY